MSNLRRSRSLALLALGLGASLVAGGAFSAAAEPAPAAPPAPAAQSATPWVVTVGDSYISGEAGRWAGNSAADPSRSDALGPTAYFDNAAGTAERLPGCHRSRSAEAYIGAGTAGFTIACSGARTSSTTVTPGLDFAGTSGVPGQAAQLRAFASTHRVKMVVVSIGGNDFNFAATLQGCVGTYLTTVAGKPRYCADSPVNQATFSPQRAAVVADDIAVALRNVRQGMRLAGYRDAEWTMVVQNYPQTLGQPTLRYPVRDPRRITTGGCPLWDRDIMWANSTAVPQMNRAIAAGVARSMVAGIKFLNVTELFSGHRLCGAGSATYAEARLPSWRVPTAVDRTEWVSPIRNGPLPYQAQESLHPNYWGQLALRSCLRQVWNQAKVRGGTCIGAGLGLSTRAEPRVSLR